MRYSSSFDFIDHCTMLQYFCHFVIDVVYGSAPSAP